MQRCTLYEDLFPEQSPLPLASRLYAESLRRPFLLPTRPPRESDRHRQDPGPPDLLSGLPSPPQVPHAPSLISENQQKERNTPTSTYPVHLTHSLAARVGSERAEEAAL